MLVDGRRLGQGSPNTAIQSPAPDLDQIPPGIGGPHRGGHPEEHRPPTGSDAIAGVINFIMKKDFQGVCSSTVNTTRTCMATTMPTCRTLVRGFGYAPATGTSQDGRQRSFDLLMGTNFADGEGNVTGYLSYRHADAVPSSDYDFGGCELYPNYANTSHGNTVVGSHCDGSANSNLFQPNTGPQAGNFFSVLGHSFVPFGTPGTTPPAAFNSQPTIYMTREDDRANAAILGHMKVTWIISSPTPSSISWTIAPVKVTAPAAAFYYLVQSFRSHRDQRLPGQLQQPAAERPGAIHLVHARANCGRERQSQGGLLIGCDGRSVGELRGCRHRTPQHRGRAPGGGFRASELSRGAGHQG